MKKAPKDRLSASEAVKHPWIQHKSKVRPPAGPPVVEAPC